MAQPSVNLVPLDIDSRRHNEHPALRTDSDPARSPDTLLYRRHSRKDVCRHLFYLFAFFLRVLHSDHPYADSAFASLLIHESYLPVQDTDLWAHTDSPRCRCAHGGNLRLCRDFNRIHLPVPSPAPPLHGGVRAVVAAARSHRWVMLIGYRTKHIILHYFPFNSLMNSIIFQTKLDLIFSFFDMQWIFLHSCHAWSSMHSEGAVTTDINRVGSLSMWFRIARAHILQTCLRHNSRFII